MVVLNAFEMVLADSLEKSDELAEPLDIPAATSNADVMQIGPVIKGHDIKVLNLRLAVLIQIHSGWKIIADPGKS